jgi:hypothetical protein
MHLLSPSCVLHVLLIRLQNDRQNNIISTHYEAPKLCNIDQEPAFRPRRALLTPLSVKYLLREEHEIAKHGLRCRARRDADVILCMRNGVRAET